MAGTAGYSFGNLLLPGYDLPWEARDEVYPPNFASPKDICIEASNGASDYGNKFGEPLLLGFSRSFGMRLPDGEYLFFLSLSLARPTSGPVTKCSYDTNELLFPSHLSSFLSFLSLPLS